MNSHSGSYKEEHSSFDVEAFKTLYTTFSSATLDRLPNLYSAYIKFKDPIHQLQGINELDSYFAGFFNTKMDCQFVFVNQIINSDQAFFQWQMHYRHPRLKAGKALTIDGGTLIKFNSHIYYHEDFYDMSAMLYQHIPVLGWVVKKINKSLVSKL